MTRPRTDGAATPLGAFGLPWIRRIAGASSVALTSIVATMPPALAAPGDLDPTFGAGGVVTTSFVHDPPDDHFGAYAYVVGIEPDGSIVAGGWAGPGGPAEFALARYDPDGALDDTFDGDGKVTSDFGPGSDEVRALAFPPGGQTLAVGVAGFVRFALARYELDGTLDATFSSNGKATTRFRVGGEHLANAVSLQPDGRILVAGAAGVEFGPPGETAGRFAIARYDPDGSRDETFGGDGRTTTNFTRGIDIAERIAVKNDGTIVVVGKAKDGRKLAIAAYDPGGTLDTDFSVDGKEISAFVPGAEISAIAIQPDGKIVAAGFFEDLTTVALARYHTDGTPDATFGSDGRVMTQLTDAFFIVDDVAVQANGEILLAGEGSGVGYISAFTLARYRVGGEMDTTFGTGGFAVTDLSPFFDTAYGVAIQSDGRIVAAGTAAATDFGLARYLAN